MMLSNRDNKALARAARVAGRSENKHALGAVLVSAGRTLAVSPNRNRNCPDYVDFIHCSEHAEEAVLRLAGSYADGATVYVVRVNKSGVRRMAKPCNRCATQLSHAGVSRVVYSGDDGRVFSSKVDELLDNPYKAEYPLKKVASW